MTSPGHALPGSDGVNTATVQQAARFGDDGFGTSPFGGYVTTVTATLAGNGVGTAVATEVLVLAEIQYV